MTRQRFAATRYVLGLDLGTSSCKACLVAGDGTPVGEAGAGYPTHSPDPLWAEQDPADWLRAASEAARQVLAETDTRPAAVAGIALTSAAHIGVLLDGQGVPVRRAILWNDQRSTEDVAELEREAGEGILRATYQAVSTSWTLPHLRWVRRHDPEAWSRTRLVLLSKDYLARWLTGSAATDPGTALSSQLWDVAAGAWSGALCELAGITPAMLPEVLSPTARAGGLTKTAAEALGPAPGTPVVVGALDSATELLAAGVCRPGQGMVRLATGGGVQRVVNAPSPHRQRITYPHAVNPYWYCQAGTSACASAVAWGIRFLAGESGVSFETWDSWAAETPPGAEGLLFHPYLAGERAPHWDPDLRGSFVGATFHHGRGHAARAIYEGTAFSIRQAMSVLPDEGESDEPLAVGGGGTRSTLWVQILADVLARPLRVVDASSAYGAALIGCAGLGLVESLEQAAAARGALGRLVTPDAANATFYAEWFGLYVEAHERLAPLYHRMAGTHSAG